MTTADLVTQFKQDLDDAHRKGFEDGKNSVVDYTKYAESIKKIRRDLITEKEITITLPIATDISNLFDISTFENRYVEHITVNCPNSVIAASAVFFAYSPSDTVLKHITLNVDISQAKNTVNMFRGCQALEIIDGTPLDFSSGTSLNIFNDCLSVKEFRVANNCIKLSFSIPKLDKLSTDTRQSIFDGLATVDTAQTLTLHANVKILQSQVDSANAKGWTVAGGTVVSEEEYYA